MVCVGKDGIKYFLFFIFFNIFRQFLRSTHNPGFFNNQTGVIDRKTMS